ncbi:uncharacterized protein HRG_01588 [Hirsutella rhossiliensis]|uniref:Uncharacterized protein n=1 Tax=Hirsutella rhossiliensis TaxID=111463 RepID=A0A9P8N5L2_9HYPO|nr:uncharacterized protein HRG_01588 [Hirsutella rhossiliensis]KAH0966179.1 hypothetical protein HRG_01588 [Hirsutella rhossiliensis]
MTVSFEAAIQRRWRLLGTSRLARLIAKIGITTPATPATESRPADDVAGKTTVITTASTRRGARTAPNPFRQTDHKEYPARPRRSHGQLVRLTKIEKYAVRNIGSQQYQQVNMVLEGAETDDDAPEVRQRALDCSVVLADAAHSCTSTGNISPGVDGITVRMLRRIWSHIRRSGGTYLPKRLEAHLLLACLGKDSSV